MSRPGCKAIAVKPNRLTAYLVCLLMAASGNALAWAAEQPADDGLAVPYRFGDVERWAPVFERPQRDSYQMPERVVATLDLAPGLVVADVGAATGYFARRIARVVGETGLVYAVDIEPGLLAWLDMRAKTKAIGNIETLIASASDSRLPDRCCDLIFLCNTYHMVAARVDYLKHLQRKLKPDGRIVIIDWRKKSLPRGPRSRWKLTNTQVTNETARAGLCIVDRPDYLPYQYFFILQRCQ